MNHPALLLTINRGKYYRHTYVKRINTVIDLELLVQYFVILIVKVYYNISKKENICFHGIYSTKSLTSQRVYQVLKFLSYLL